MHIGALGSHSLIVESQLPVIIELVSKECSIVLTALSWVPIIVSKVAIQSSKITDAKYRE